MDTHRCIEHATIITFRWPNYCWPMALMWMRSPSSTGLHCIRRANGCIRNALLCSSPTVPMWTPKPVDVMRIVVVNGDSINNVSNSLLNFRSNASPYCRIGFALSCNGRFAALSSGCAARYGQQLGWNSRRVGPSQRSDIGHLRDGPFGVPEHYRDDRLRRSSEIIIH